MAGVAGALPPAMRIRKQGYGKAITIIELTVPLNSPDCIIAVHEYKFPK